MRDSVDRKALADNLERLMKAAGLKAKELNDQAGLPEGTVHDLLRMARGNPTMKVMIPLAVRLGCGVDALIGIAPPDDHPPADPAIHKVLDEYPKKVSRFLSKNDLTIRKIPLYGVDKGGFSGLNINEGSIVAVVRTPNYLESVSDPFGIVVPDETMAPRYRRGEWAFVDTALLPTVGDDVLIERVSGPASIRVLAGETETMIFLTTLDPDAREELCKDAVRRISAIVGRHRAGHA